MNDIFFSAIFFSSVSGQSQVDRGQWAVDSSRMGKLAGDRSALPESASGSPRRKKRKGGKGKWTAGNNSGVKNTKSSTKTHIGRGESTEKQVNRREKPAGTIRRGAKSPRKQRLFEPPPRWPKREIRELFRVGGLGPLALGLGFAAARPTQDPRPNPHDREARTVGPRPVVAARKRL